MTVEQQTEHLPEPEDGLGPAIVPARARLEKLIGRDFTRLLLVALAPCQGRRASSSP